ncbi:unnamed protein product [Effrenium voratum]|uniref:Secreted protein n=1 Tax=Effrenium voratum TaxID=2562239 RepID=A0AA36MMW9_9DINO|nr:unnamed protein product [Effrenium voratum]CAJ1373007.1 unnamed protein product [Effrenium voratum]
MIQVKDAVLVEHLLLWLALLARGFLALDPARGVLDDVALAQAKLGAVGPNQCGCAQNTAAGFSLLPHQRTQSAGFQEKPVPGLILAGVARSGREPTAIVPPQATI